MPFLNWFSLAFLVSASSIIGAADGFTMPSPRLQHSSASTSSATSLDFSRSNLFSSRSQSPQSLFQVRMASKKQQSSPNSRLKALRLVISSLCSQWGTRLRRSAVLMFTIATIWLSAAGFHTAPSNAASAAAAASSSSSTVVNRVLPKVLRSKSLDDIVDKYVKSHMFDDDVYDPVESAYREAFEDNVVGAHPKALAETRSSVLGSSGIKVEKEKSGGIVDYLSGAIRFIRVKTGFSETGAILLIAAAFVIAGPVGFAFGGMMAGGMSKRKMNKIMKKRYGETYT